MRIYLVSINDPLAPNYYYVNSPESLTPYYFRSCTYIFLIEGVFILYPMKAPTREAEKNPHILFEAGKHYKEFFEVRRQDPNNVLEGTGSLIFDVINKKIYVNLSERADENVFNEFLEKFNSISKTPYKGVTYRSCDREGNPVYHTNVVMAILKDHVILCTESIRDEEERARVVRELTDPALNKHPKQLIDISYDEVNNMGGNMI